MNTVGNNTFLTLNFHSASEMTYIVSGGALNSTHSLTQLSHILLHSPKRNIFNYLTYINILTRAYSFKGTI